MTAMARRPVSSGVAGLLTGAACGALWQCLDEANTVACEHADPTAWCGLGRLLSLAIALAFSVPGVALLFALLAPALARRRWPLVLVATALVVLSAIAFAVMPRFGWFRVAIPTALLGAGLYWACSPPDAYSAAPPWRV
ncbi:hypothetical protein [Amycolatopsis sp. CA-230715]|uniref:hypothetical protein n=1 Tax=Amycolatopsis sp. CA-230715 TaxID=2745196 RepID=UPI001C02EA00|nr:hypothetical protein [Amycolatopsis sp. CA-230715]